MSSEFMEKMADLEIQKQVLEQAFDALIDAIDNLDTEDLDKLNIELNLKGKFDADLFFDIVEKYLGTPDNGAVNRIANFIGYKVDNIIDTFNYTELENPSGEVYNIVVAIDYDLINGKTVVNPTFYVYADKINGS